MAKCGKCGAELEAKDAGARDHCPICNSTNRTISAAGAVHVKTHVHAGHQAHRDSRMVGFGEWERGGIVTWADDKDGFITTSVKGPSPQNEHDSLPACRIVIRKLNLLGATWNEPDEWPDQDSHIDCFATNADDETETLHIQVVSLMGTPWRREWANSKMNAVSHAPDEWADIFWTAVMKKARRITQNERSQLVLAVDANRLAGASFDSPVKRVREKYASSFASFGFRAVWLVGPSASMTHRLDAHH